MMGPVTTKRVNVVPMILQDSVHLRKVRDVILGIIFFDRRDAAALAEVCDGLVEILVVFFSEDSFEFLAVVTGAGFETFVAVKDVEDLEFHAGKTAGHYGNYKITNNIKHIFYHCQWGGFAFRHINSSAKITHHCLHEFSLNFPSTAPLPRRTLHPDV